MTYELRTVNRLGNPNMGDTPKVICHSKASVHNYIAEKIAEEGSDWQAGALFKTRKMSECEGFFTLGGDLMRY